MSKKKKKKNNLKSISLEKQKEQMITRYGTSCNWVSVVMHLTHQEMIDYFGEQCKEFESLCANCTNWVSWHKTGTAEIIFEREELIKIIGK